ncbi:MAG: hypothetical protein WBE48_08040 [Xanthobacteraceae bacterium]
MDNCDSLAAIYLGTATDRGNCARISDFCSFAGRFARCVKLENSTAAGTLTVKSVASSPHSITNSEVLPQKHKKAALAVVLSLAVSWLN